VEALSVVDSWFFVLTLEPRSGVRVDEFAGRLRRNRTALGKFVEPGVKTRRKRSSAFGGAALTSEALTVSSQDR
jgi:hypothetical protein